MRLQHRTDLNLVRLRDEWIKRHNVHQKKRESIWQLVPNIESEVHGRPDNGLPMLQTGIVGNGFPRTPDSREVGIHLDPLQEPRMHGLRADTGAHGIHGENGDE